MEYKIGIIGCGTVGTGFLQILKEKASWLKTHHDFEAKVVAVCDKVKGSVVAPEGIDLEDFLLLLSRQQKISAYAPSGQEQFLDPLDMIENVETDIICELTPTDIKTAEPATSYIRKALRTGKHVVTSNKGPVALYFHELNRLARQNHLFFRFEGTVMSGTPVFSLFEAGLAGNTVLAVRGILNGTTNFILSRMEEESLSYDQALQEAQQLGYAETDPTADIEGFDAMAKVLILANVLFGYPLKPEQVHRQGISGITPGDINKALPQNKRIKLIAQAWRDGDEVKAKVAPEEVPLTDPLARIGGAQNALLFELDLLGKVMIQGPGAGKKETGYAILNDILFIHENLRRFRTA